MPAGTLEATSVTGIADTSHRGYIRWPKERASPITTLTLFPDRHRYIDHFSAAAAATVDPVCFGLT